MRTLHIHAPFALSLHDNGLVETRAPVDGRQVTTTVHPDVIAQLHELGFLSARATVPLAESATDEPPVFLVGCQRSGTTLLRYLFDAHERFACPPESKFISGLWTFLAHPQTYSSLLSLGLTESDIYRHLRGFIDGIMSEYRRRKNKARWADKTPNYYRMLEFIDQIYEHRARYVFIVRHPFDCVQSLRSMLHFEQFARLDADITRALDAHGGGTYGFAKYWCEVNERLRMFALAHPERVSLLRYEDLVREPVSVMGATLQSLGETCDAELVANAFSVPHDDGAGDPLIRHTNGVEKGSVGRSQSWSTAEREAVWELVGPLAARFGYSIEPERVDVR